MRVDLEKAKFINPRVIPWIIWSIAGLFYFFEIILRMMPGTMTGELMHIFKINATELGVFTAFYYWSYTLMQIPAGLIVDRFSIRKTLLSACVFCLGGFLIVHSTHNIHIAEFGRFVVGFGSAFAYVSALKVASVWLPPSHFGLASCIVDSLGMIGAMFAEVVLVRINVQRGYHETVFFLIVTGCVIAFLIYLLLKDSPRESSKKKHITPNVVTVDKTDVFSKLAIICKNPQIWLIGIVGCLFYLPSSVIGDVWGIPYLKSVYGLTKEQASDLLGIFFAGWIIAGPFLGAISDKIKRRVMPIVLTILLDAALFSIVIFTPQLTGHTLSYMWLAVIFFFIGVATGTHPLVFALAKENYPIKIAGTVVAMTNMLIMLGGLLFQPIVGLLLDFSHHSIGQHAVEHYTSGNYTFALSIIPISLMICLIVMFFIRETGDHIKEM